MKAVEEKLYGKDTEYRMLHYWVEQQLGKPSGCENCLTSDAGRFEWANLSGEYLRDISDWARLCKRCHRWIDNSFILYRIKSVCIRGHTMVGENLGYKKRSGGSQRRYCRACNRIDLKNFRLRKKEV